MKTEPCSIALRYWLPSGLFSCSVLFFFTGLSAVFFRGPQQSSYHFHWPPNPSSERPSSQSPDTSTAPPKTPELQRGRGNTLAPTATLTVPQPHPLVGPERFQRLGSRIACFSRGSAVTTLVFRRMRSQGHPPNSLGPYSDFLPSAFPFVLTVATTKNLSSFEEIENAGSGDPYTMAGAVVP